MSIIGLAGSAGSGKDTAARIIRAETGYRRLSFAAPMRAMVSDIFDLTDDQIHDRTLKEQIIPEWGLSPRQMMQRFGTEVVRSLHPDVWVRYARRIIERSDAPGWIMTDCRFQNELAMVRDMGGVVWWIERQSGTPHQHSSETTISVKDCDRVIDNTGTLDELRDRVLAALGPLDPPPLARAA